MSKLLENDTNAARFMAGKGVYHENFKEAVWKEVIITLF
jgi:hypothetical protein